MLFSVEVPLKSACWQVDLECEDGKKAIGIFSHVRPHSSMICQLIQHDHGEADFTCLVCPGVAHPISPKCATAAYLHACMISVWPWPGADFNL